jgi:hypothetical protein
LEIVTNILDDSRSISSDEEENVKNKETISEFCVISEGSYSLQRQRRSKVVPVLN